MSRSHTSARGEGSHSRMDPKIFTRADGYPVNFFLMSIEDPKVVSQDQIPLSNEHVRILRKKIERYGGNILDEFSLDEVDTVIVNEEAVDDYRRFYHLSFTTYAEPPGFIAKCISQGIYRHEPFVQRAMGGRPPGYKRAPYTPADERHMCLFIAKAVPYPAAGGRLGPGLWKYLTSQSETPGYEWVRRHSWQSWQEHYKKNRTRLDAVIADIVNRLTPPPDGKGLYELSRLATKRNLVGIDEERAWYDDDEAQEAMEIDEVEGLITPQAMRIQRSASRSDSRSSQVENPRQARRSAPYPRLSLIRRSATNDGRKEEEEESSDGEETAEGAMNFDAADQYIEVPEDLDEDVWPEDTFEKTTSTVHEGADNADNFSLGFGEAGPSGSVRSPAPSPPVRRAAQRTQPVPRPSSRPRPRPANAFPTSGVPMSSQATLVGPVPSQLRQIHKSPAQAQSTPLRRNGNAHAVSPSLGLDEPATPIESADELLPNSPPVASPVRSPRQKMVAEVVITPSKDRPRNYARSGTLRIDPLQAANRSKGQRESLSDIEVQIEQDIVVEEADEEDADEGATDEELEDERDADADADEGELYEEVDEENEADDARSDGEGSPEPLEEDAGEENGDPDELQESPLRAGVATRMSGRRDEVDARSSDDERTHQRVNSQRQTRASSGGRTARARAPGVFPPSASRELDHHDFSASDADDEEDDLKSDQYLSQPRAELPESLAQAGPSSSPSVRTPLITYQLRTRTVRTTRNKA